MLDAEAALPEEERIQCLSIVTPNDSHADISCMALERGFHVICDKPLAGNLEDALRVAAAVEKTGLLFGLTHTYTGYPMVIEARERVRAGVLGNIRRVSVTFLQDWLAFEEDTTASKQALWRTDPSIGGESGAFADIGTHAFNLLEFVSGDEVTAIAAELRNVVAGRSIDDDGAAMVRLKGGGSGVMSVSQVCPGAVDGMRLDVYGDKASLHWAQADLNTLTIRRRGEPDEVLRPGQNVAYLSEATRARCWTPAGHPEGFIEAFSNLYSDFADAVIAYPKETDNGCATVTDGVRGMRFVRAAIESSQHDSRWTDL